MRPTNGICEALRSTGPDRDCAERMIGIAPRRDHSVYHTVLGKRRLFKHELGFELRRRQKSGMPTGEVEGLPSRRSRARGGPSPSLR